MMTQQLQTDSGTTPNGAEHIPKQDTRERMRAMRDQILADDPFFTMSMVHALLDSENRKSPEPLDKAEVVGICREATYKRGLVPKEDTFDFLTDRARRCLEAGETPDQIEEKLQRANLDSCEESLPEDAIDGIVSGVVGGGAHAATVSGRFNRVKLGGSMINGVPAPEELEPDVLIKGGVHQIFTGPGEGKSWLALWLTKNAVERSETVLFFDMENGPRIVSERLNDLCADAGTIDDHLHYFHVPGMDLGRDSLSAYRTLLDELQPDLLIFDSWIGFLASCGLDENSPTNIEEWANSYVHPAKSRGCTVVILDHVPHDADRSRGATRKKDVVDVQWHLKKKEAFDRGTVGYIQLAIKKDREAWLPERAGFAVGGTDDGFVFERSSGMSSGDQSGDGLTPSARAAHESLQRFEELGATYSEWRDSTSFRGKPMSDSTFRTARNLLMSDDHRLARQEGDRYYSNQQQLL